MARVLVTDGDQRATLAIVRSLGSAGHDVWVASDSGRSIAGASKHCSSESRLPSPLESADRFFRELRILVDRSRPDVLLPVTEETLRAILPKRSELNQVHIPFPAEETFRDASDKAVILHIASQLGIPDATLARVSAPEELLAEAENWEASRFPMVLKPTRSVVSSGPGSRKTSVMYVRDKAQLVDVQESIDLDAFPLLAQRLVEGPGVGVFLLMWDGEVRAAFAHRRIREKPPSGGVSVLRESVRIPTGLEQASAALLRQLEWRGVAMVEYKQDHATGEYVLMEVNGRFWGSLQLAVDAGVDFPRMLVDIALGGPPVTAPAYRIGVQTRWVLGDLDHLIARLRRKESSDSLNYPRPERIRATLDFLRAFLPPIRGEVLRARDPRPATREFVQWLRQVLRVGV